MKLIDLHCDTISKVHFSRRAGLDRNKFHVDLEKLKKADSQAQFFAIFNPYTFLNRSDLLCSLKNRTTKKMIRTFYREMEKNSSEISHVRSFGELERNTAEGKISALLTIEGAGDLGNRIERVDEYYSMGVRLMTLLWSRENCLGYPHSKKPAEMNRRLKHFGIEVVTQMDELGMIIDVSHLSDGGFSDVLKTAKGPVIASHSDARNLTNHTRNLRDDQIKALAERGGVIGVNFCPPFIHVTGEKDECRLEDIIRHVEYLRNTGGIDVCAVGSDYDGISGKLELADISRMGLLADGLKDRGFSDGDIEKVFSGNALRVIKDVLK